MFRDLEDYHRGFNCFAVALHKTDSVGLVESFMATHTHQMVQTHAPKDFMFCFRNPYAKYFNNKYGRSGKLAYLPHAIALMNAQRNAMMFGFLKKCHLA